METRVSTKGQVVLPSPLRRRLGIGTGDPLDVSVEQGSIILTPREKVRRSAKIVSDPITGLPVLRLAEDVPVLSSKHVAEILADFP